MAEVSLNGENVILLYSASTTFPELKKSEILVHNSLYALLKLLVHAFTR